MYVDIPSVGVLSSATKIQDNQYFKSKQVGLVYVASIITLT